MTANRISPAKMTAQLQQMLNETAAAQNYELEANTTGTYEMIRQIEDGLPEDQSKLSSNSLLFGAWIRWLSDWDHYSLHLLHRRRLIGYLNRCPGIKGFTLQIYPFAANIYSIRARSGIIEIRLHEAMDHMSDTECRNFAQYIAGNRWKDLKRLLRNYQDTTPEYAELFRSFREIKAVKAAENDTAGRFFDLEAVFQACNVRNFGGKMQRPRGLHWSARVNHSTMGSYNLREDTVMINRGLDSGKVPAYVLDFVMYHELLHKLLGIETSGSRNRAHTPEFRKLERAHPDYQRAQDFIRKNAARL